MNKHLKFKVDSNLGEEERYLLEAEIEVKRGVGSVLIDTEKGECSIDFNDDEMTEEKLVNILKEKNLKPLISKSNKNEIKECVLYVEGMYCSSCELMIEKSITKMDGVKMADASTAKSEVIIEYVGRKPDLDALNKMFKKENYHFSENKQKKSKPEKTVEINKKGQLIIDREKINSLLIVFSVSVLLIVGFLSLRNSGLLALVNVNEKSGLSMFFFFGLFAGFSSCAALVGGIVLSMSKQWTEKFSANDSNITKLQPHILFNVGRLLSYSILGGILGALGSFFQLSITFTALLVFGVSVMMIFLAFQMLGIKYFQRFQMSMPKFVTRYIANESNFNGKYTPFTMGALTFFLPCGFTITAQGLALTSGSMLQGSLIMFLFALGTVPSLMIIGLSSVTFSKKPHVTARFMKVAGTLVLFFALFNINAQLNVLGYISFGDINFSSGVVAEASAEGLPPIVNGVQILKMDATSYNYKPNKLKVRAGVPVRWEISDRGTSGCTNAIISKSLFDGQIALTPGKTSIKEFTAEKPGKYKFSCWMGMVSGSIEVVDIDSKGKIIPSKNALEEPAPSGASGCGCGGGGGGSRSGSSSCGG